MASSSVADLVVTNAQVVNISPSGFSVFLRTSESADARAEQGIRFFLPTNDASWNPPVEDFQAWPFIYGTIITSIGVPVLVRVYVRMGVRVFHLAGHGVLSSLWRCFPACRWPPDRRLPPG